MTESRLLPALDSIITSSFLKNIFFISEERREKEFLGEYQQIEDPYFSVIDIVFREFQINKCTVVPLAQTLFQGSEVVQGLPEKMIPKNV